VKFFGRLSHASLSGDRPEVAQMMEIQPIHDARIDSQKLSV
jgi:hypothetical protein